MAKPPRLWPSGWGPVDGRRIPPRARPSGRMLGDDGRGVQTGKTSTAYGVRAGGGRGGPLGRNLPRIRPSGWERGMEAGMGPADRPGCDGTRTALGEGRSAQNIEPIGWVQCFCCAALLPPFFANAYVTFVKGVCRTLAARLYARAPQLSGIAASRARLFPLDLAQQTRSPSRTPLLLS